MARDAPCREPALMGCCASPAATRVCCKVRSCQPACVFSASASRVRGLKADRLLSADAVEKVRWWERQTGRRGTAGRCRGSGWHGVHREWNELGELAEVLGCSGEVELVTGAVRPA